MAGVAAVMDPSPAYNNHQPAVSVTTMLTLDLPSMFEQAIGKESFVIRSTPASAYPGQAPSPTTTQNSTWGLKAEIRDPSGILRDWKAFMKGRLNQNKLTEQAFEWFRLSLECSGSAGTWESRNVTLRCSIPDGANATWQQALLPRPGQQDQLWGHQANLQLQQQHMAGGFAIAVQPPVDIVLAGIGRGRARYRDDRGNMVRVHNMVNGQQVVLEEAAQHTPENPCRLFDFGPMLNMFANRGRQNSILLSLKCTADVRPVQDPASAQQGNWRMTPTQVNTQVTYGDPQIEAEPESSDQNANDNVLLNLFHGDPFTQDNFTDCVVVYGETRFYCHRAILAARGEAIKAQLSNEPNPDDPPGIRVINIHVPGLDNLDVESVTVFMKLVYQPNFLHALGQNDNFASARLLTQVYRLLDYYGCADARKVVQRLKSNVTVDTVMDMMLFADMFNLDDLMAQCIKVCLGIPSAEWKREVWIQFGEQHPKLTMRIMSGMAEERERTAQAEQARDEAGPSTSRRRRRGPGHAPGAINYDDAVDPMDVFDFPDF